MIKNNEIHLIDDWVTTDKILDLVEPDLHVATIKRFIHYRILDLRVALTHLTRKHEPKTYLEIGVRRGYSMAMVAANSNVNIIGIDPWITNYGGAPNPGPDFIRKQMQSVNHSGQLILKTGDSAVIVPELANNLTLKYDLITIDGDHSYEATLTDLRNCIPIGNIVLLDDVDISIDVIGAWNTAMNEFPDYSFERYDMVGMIREK